MTENPFVYGEIVPRAAFVGRRTELDRLAADLADCQKIFLISPRRYGKSSLVRQALVSLARDRVVTLEITVSSFSSYVAFLEGYTRALAALDARPLRLRSGQALRLRSGQALRLGSGQAGRARSWLREMFSGVKPELRGDADGPGVSVAFPSVRTARDAARLAEEVFVLPSRIAARLNRRLAIAFDEFQAIGSFNGGSVEQVLRAAVQQQRQVGYVFAGSEPTLMEQMIGPRRPFYKAGPVMRLGKIPPDLFAGFVDDRFKRSGFVPETGFGAAVVDLAGNLPYDVQRLAHETWDDVQRTRRRSVGLDDLHTTLHRLLAEHETFFETMWLRLTLAQRGVLRAVVIEQGIEILSAETRSRHRLGVASSVQAALGALLKHDLVAREDDGRYVVIDSLMREWVARRTY